MIYIVLPAYNEEETLPPLLGAIREALGRDGAEYRVFVVNDGSTDRTAGVARENAALMPVSCVEHPRNMGLAEAIKTGFKKVLKEAADTDVIFTMDSDNTHPPDLMPRMAVMIGQGYDVVIASRYRKGSAVVGLSWDRRLMSFGARVIFKMLFPTRGVRDYTCGYRAYRAGVMREMFGIYRDEFISEKGFSCMVDIILKMRRHGLKFGEVPLVLRYDRKVGVSKMKVFKTARDTLRLILKRL